MSTDPGIFVIFNFSLVGSEEISKVFFFKGKMHVKERRSFLWNFKFRSREGAGRAAAGPAAAFVEPEDQIGMHAAAALVDSGELGGAETADSYFLNFLHDEFAAIFHGDPGRAFAATEGEFFFNAIARYAEFVGFGCGRCDCGYRQSFCCD